MQSSTGEVADLDAIEAAARHHGALTVIDATHGIGWLPFDASRYDAVACACYKWLMCPRGTAFMVLTEALEERMTPHQAGWFAAADPLKDQFGPPLRLGDGARRFDTSPAWFSWVGTEPALRAPQRDRRGDDPRARPALANRFRAGLGWSRATPRSSPPTSPTRRRSSRGRGSWPPPARAVSGRHFTSTTPRPTSTRRSSALHEAGDR